MRANIEQRDFQTLGELYRSLVAALLETVNLPPVVLDVDPSPGGDFRGFDSSRFYAVVSGSIRAVYQGRTIYTLEPGDMLLPDITGTGEPDFAVTYNSESGARLHSYPALEFMSRVFDDSAAVRLWTRLLVTYAGLMVRITAASVPEDAVATPGYEAFEPGDIIIRQGDRADYVFYMTSGLAEVVVDGVTVGSIGDGEIFGAMAALTQADRSATVRAKTACSVVKVPKEQFTELIKNNPATIHGLLVDMANSIVNLNEQLVGMRGNPRTF